MAKPKAVNFEVIRNDHEAYFVLEHAMAWHEELDGARVGLAWRKGYRPDRDGQIVLGKCQKVSDLQKEFFDYDFIVILNREYWHGFNDKQRLALLDHELCHAAPALDEESGMQKRDERHRKVWRVRKHDIEEFRSVVERHGCYKSDLEKFAKSLRKSSPALFEEKSAAA